MKKKILANYWRLHKIYNNMCFKGSYEYSDMKRLFVLRSVDHPRVVDEWFESHEKAKAAGWKHIKKAKKK